MSTIKLGTLITTEEHRDAIHQAVAPVSSDEKLAPGQHVALVDGDSTKVASKGTPIGIVDPFLFHYVTPGQKFWLLLYPQTVTSLRHDWQHPAFENQAMETTKATSKQWLLAFCTKHEGLDYDDMIRELQKEDGYVVQDGDDSARDVGVTDEFRRHFRNVTGKEVQGVFSCSC